MTESLGFNVTHKFQPKFWKKMQKLIFCYFLSCFFSVYQVFNEYMGEGSPLKIVFHPHEGRSSLQEGWPAGGEMYNTVLVAHLRYDLTDIAGVLENKVLGMFHGLDD